MFVLALINSDMINMTKLHKKSSYIYIYNIWQTPLPTGAYRSALSPWKTSV